ncbi:MAG: AAA family ATPase, partial [Sutterellaceae bacterium]|nr:AAA family ATPase [Sutterellaceae bacterium]
ALMANNAAKARGIDMTLSDDNPIGDFYSFLGAQDDLSTVLLIDAYDAPLTAHFDNPALFAELSRILSYLYTVIKSCNARLRFFFMTGVLKLPNAGIFQSMNNVTDISCSAKFADMLGFTREEIRENYAQQLMTAAQKLQTTVDDLLEKLEAHYGGYSFDDRLSASVFCPKMVLDFLSNPTTQFDFSQLPGNELLARLTKQGAQPNFSIPAAVYIDDLQGANIVDPIKSEVLLTQAGILAPKKVIVPGIFEVGYANKSVIRRVSELGIEMRAAS